MVPYVVEATYSPNPQIEVLIQGPQVVVGGGY